MISSGCLADTGFRPNKVHYHRWIINAFMRLLLKMLFLYCSELHNNKLH